MLAKQLFVIGTAVAMAAWLAWFIQRTHTGRTIRSIVNNREVARTLGVSVDRTLASTFLLGGALAGVAGVLNGTYYNLVQFDMGILLTIKGFVAAVIGGLGNIYGALVGALIVGMLEAFTAGFIPHGNAYKGGGGVRRLDPDSGAEAGRHPGSRNRAEGLERSGEKRSNDGGGKRK